MAFRFWKRDPEAVMRAAKELQQATDKINQMMRNISDNLVLSGLLDPDRVDMRGASVEDAIANAVRKAVEQGLSSTQ